METRAWFDLAADAAGRPHLPGGAGPRPHYRRRRSLLRGSLARDGRVGRLDHAVLQLRTPLPETDSLLLADRGHQRGHRSHRVGGPALVRAGRGRPGARHRSLCPALVRPRYCAAVRRDRGHQLRLLQHRADGAARPAAHFLHHDRHLDRAGRHARRAADPVAMGRAGGLRGRGRVSDQGTGRRGYSSARRAAHRSAGAPGAQSPPARRGTGAPHLHRRGAPLVWRDVGTPRLGVFRELLPRRQLRALRDRSLQRPRGPGGSTGRCCSAASCRGHRSPSSG